MNNVIQTLLGDYDSGYFFSSHGSVRLIDQDGLIIKMFQALGSERTVHIKVPARIVSNNRIMDYLFERSASGLRSQKDYELALSAMEELLEVG